MTEPHKRPYRHPAYKTAYRVKNWREYAQSLRDRGAITLWITPEAISAWRAPMTGKRGVQPIYADIAIETALALRRSRCHPQKLRNAFLLPSAQGPIHDVGLPDMDIIALHHFADSVSTSNPSDAEQRLCNTFPFRTSHCLMVRGVLNVRARGK